MGQPRGDAGRTPASAAPAWGFVAAGAVGLALYLTGSPAVGSAVLVVAQLAAIAAILLGARRHLPAPRRRPWLAMAAAMTAFVVGGVLRLVVPGVLDTPPGPLAFIPDLAVFPGYLLLTYAFVTMLRQRRAADDDSARADALLIGIVAALATWAFLIAPRVSAAHLTTVPQLATACYPMVDVLLLVVVAHLLLAHGVRKPALWLVGIANVALFVGDLLYALREQGSAPAGAEALLIEVSFLTGSVVLGAAALHPSMRTLTEPQRVLPQHLGVARTVAIAAVLVTPTVMATVSPPPTTGNGIVRIILTVLLTGTIVARIARANNSRASAEARTRWQATHDVLTGLPNRELLETTVSRWCADATDRSGQVEMLFLDLDRFKMVNDTWGHQVGDELLCAVAARLRAVVRADDLVCRVGGDEFVIALAGSVPPACAETLARRLITEFTRPFQLSVGSVVVTPSIGVARSGDVEHAMELIRDADTAMYQAKDAGRNGYALFDTGLRARIQARVGVEQALRGALERGELSVHYQPIVDLGTDELAGFEALMRWQHPELGTVSPVEFIPIAEDTGLIVASGAWLLRESMEQLVSWRARRPADLPDLHMSVNISVRQLRDPGLIEVVRNSLHRTGLPASALWLEITESGVIDDLEGTLVILRELRELGVTLCIDDFGTGYSSLNYLRQLPSGIVKIDRSFVSGVGEHSGNEPIVRAVIAMAHALGQQVVAEGVETVVQRDWLRALGCDLAQGWLYGAPRPPGAQLAWMDRSVPAVPLTDPAGHGADPPGAAAAVADGQVGGAAVAATDTAPG